MPFLKKITEQSKPSVFVAGLIFLLLYWYFAFDGITFSDDVFYLLAGKKFWEGTMEFNAYHFSTRWGAYVPSGLLGYLFGLKPHLISLVSLASYLATLGLVMYLLPDKSKSWILLLWFCTQVYFLHFLTKVYPDTLLVFWTVLVPFAAVFRSKKPFFAALGLVSGLFFGFLTKETIVFLAPLPILLFFFDWKKGKQNLPFYSALLGLGIVFGALYLGYFWIKFGSPFYRFESIQDGHYISEFTYADKSGWIMLKRLTILPIITFVERSYWIWIVFSIPGLVKVWKKPESPGLEFALSLVSLLTLFWVMSTNFRFYNPLYLNPRHLIILIPTLAFLIALGWEEWTKNNKLKLWMNGLILLGVGISIFQQDWKIAGFQAAFLGILITLQGKKFIWVTAVLLLIPAFLAVNYQKNIKEYDQLMETLTSETSIESTDTIILTNNFIDFSKEVLLPENKPAQNLLFPIEKLDSLKSISPKKVTVLLYDYYQHAYPKEQVDVDALELWLQEQTLISEERQGKVWIRRYLTE
ncbi:hypothetical protein [Algoriphagus litoralis]|uniref:hypothetical protein n=1 Tax=Algoriphagus litoralis TaxID=2202829 RepID=UPI000DBA2524|nr:hypothetical protein [Algoriphagus litoralis]